MTTKTWKRATALGAGIVILAICLIATGCLSNLSSEPFVEKNVSGPPPHQPHHINSGGKNHRAQPGAAWHHRDAWDFPFLVRRRLSCRQGGPGSDCQIRWYASGTNRGLEVTF